jgi:hypothetical protein
LRKDDKQMSQQDDIKRYPGFYGSESSSSRIEKFVAYARVYHEKAGIDDKSLIAKSISTTRYTARYQVNYTDKSVVILGEYAFSRIRDAAYKCRVVQREGDLYLDLGVSKSKFAELVQKANMKYELRFNDGVFKTDEVSFNQLHNSMDSSIKCIREVFPDRIALRIYCARSWFDAFNITAGEKKSISHKWLIEFSDGYKAFLASERFTHSFQEKLERMEMKSTLEETSGETTLYIHHNFSEYKEALKKYKGEVTPYTKVTETVDIKQKEQPMSRTLLSSLRTLAGEQKDEFSQYESLPSDLKAAIQEQLQETKAAATKEAAKEILGLLSLSKQSMETRVADIRHVRRQATAIEQSIKNLERAQKFGMETNNWIPLYIAVHGTYDVGDIPDKLRVVPDDWEPKETGQ